LTNTYPSDFRTFAARDGARLPFRYFEGPSDFALIFLHGITEPSLYLRDFGQFIAREQLATVYLPDLERVRRQPLNALGIHRFDHAIVYRRQTPSEKLHGTESCQLSYRLALSRMVGNDYGTYLSRLTQPSFVLVGKDDEVFDADAYKPLYGKYCAAEVDILDDHNHDAIVMTEEALAAVAKWLETIRG